MSARLAAETLSRHLGMNAQSVLERLAEAPSLLAEGIDSGQASRLARLLQAMGLRVALDHAEPPQGLDLSIRMALPMRRQRAVNVIAAATGLDPVTVDHGLDRPTGVLLHALPAAEADRIARLIARVPSLGLTLSDPATALYDLFLPQDGPQDGPQTWPLGRLRDRLRLMGLLPDPITGATASGFDLGLARHLDAHFPGLRHHILNRAFQRFDLYLIGARGWIGSELADFLSARTAVPRCRFEVISPAQPLRIEVGLTHAAARQFRADYAAIGLHTRLDLSGLPETANNSFL